MRSSSNSSSSSASSAVASQGREPSAGGGGLGEGQQEWENPVPRSPSEVWLGTMDDEEVLRDVLEFQAHKPSLGNNLESIREEVNNLASQRPTPINMRQVLTTLDPRKIAKFLQSEMPLRIAERIKWIEDIPNWQDVPELALVHDSHMTAFRDLRYAKRKPELDDFTQAVWRAVNDQKNVVVTMARAMVQLRQERGEEYGPDFADKFLDAFLLNRIGSNVLMSQYLACAGKDTAMQTFKQTGIVDPDCDAAALCKKAASDVKILCLAETGIEPLIKVEAFSAVGDDQGVPKFSYIPSFLTYIMRELLKNSCKATVETANMNEALVRTRPVHVVICADSSRVAIRVGDRARGIPFEVGTGVWSYLYSTSRRRGDCPTELAGYGVGLPLSRLYARYLGGSLDLVSLPGYGTDAYLVLPRLHADLLEVVPDRRREYSIASLSKHML